MALKGRTKGLENRAERKGGVGKSLECGGKSVLAERQ